MFNCVSIEFTRNCICKEATFAHVPPKAREAVTIQMLVKPDAKLRPDVSGTEGRQRPAGAHWWRETGGWAQR